MFIQMVEIYFFQELARITGSIAYERFSGSQIAKIADTKKIAYANTEVIFKILK